MIAVWAGSTASYGARVLVQLTVAWASYEATQSLAWAGVSLAALALPQLVLGLVAGGMVDRFGARLAAVRASESAAIVVMVAAVVLASAPEPPLAAIVILATVFGALDAVRRTATGALMYAATTWESAGRAIALMNVGWHLGALLATAAATPLLAANWGAGALAVAGPLLLVASVAFRRSPPGQRTEPQTDWRSAASASVRLLYGSRLNVVVAVVVVVAELFGHSSLALLPGIAEDLGRSTAVVLGILFAARSVGAIGALAVLTRARPRREALLLVASVVAFGAGLIGLGVAPGAAAAVVAVAVVGGASACCDSLSQTLLQRASGNAPAAAMGVWVFGVGTGPVGFVLLGALGDGVGARTAQVLAGVLLVLFALVVAVAARDAWDRGPTPRRRSGLGQR